MFAVCSIISPTDWSRVLRELMRVVFGLQTEIRMAVTIRTKWDCFLPCIATCKLELDEQRLPQRFSQSFMLLPDMNETDSL